MITSRHALTAAHCILGTLYVSFCLCFFVHLNFNLKTYFCYFFACKHHRSLVRLGEHDITSTDDGEVEDVKVVRSLPHENYNKKDGTNDIAMLYLERDVEFTSKRCP